MATPSTCPEPLSGMLTLDESVKRLLHDGRISRETAESFVTSADRLR
jgi:Tfp pilus assembly pilus retraction ATPase PilT